METKIQSYIKQSLGMATKITYTNKLSEEEKGVPIKIEWINNRDLAIPRTKTLVISYGVSMRSPKTYEDRTSLID